MPLCPLKSMLRSWLEAPRIHFLTCGWALAILVLSATPGKELPDLQFEHLDKVLHAIGYALGAVLLCFSFSAIGSGSLLTVLILVTGYGFLMEWMQGTFFEGRYFDVLDGIANGAGALIGIVIFRLLDRTF